MQGLIHTDRIGKRAIQYALAALFLFALGSCTSTPRQERQPVSDHPAVVEWVYSARDLRDRKLFEQAAAKLERALRIEPGNARLWHELARVHLEQGNFDQAIQFAYKSNALSRDDKLKSSNRRLVKTAQSQLYGGDNPGSDL